ncbi:MAG: hypothetical protein H7839_04850 [Magnetococcus sp. YQC-5]
MNSCQCAHQPHADILGALQPLRPLECAMRTAGNAMLSMRSAGVTLTLRRGSMPRRRGGRFGGGICGKILCV